MKKPDPKNHVKDTERRVNDNEPEGYPLYPPSDDIYNRYHEEQDIDPEDPSKLKEPLPAEDELVLPDEELGEILPLDEDLLHTDLDIPGAELDDDLEEIGSEDEENNYYSIGGDNHHDLEEDDGLLDEEI
jgi:hypothetical protein